MAQAKTNYDEDLYIIQAALASFKSYLVEYLKQNLKELEIKDEAAAQGYLRVLNAAQSEAEFKAAFDQLKIAAGAKLERQINLAIANWGNTEGAEPIIAYLTLKGTPFIWPVRRKTIVAEMLKGSPLTVMLQQGFAFGEVGTYDEIRLAEHAADIGWVVKPTPTPRVEKEPAPSSSPPNNKQINAADTNPDGNDSKVEDSETQRFIPPPTNNSTKQDSAPIGNLSVINRSESVPANYDPLFNPGPLNDQEDLSQRSVFSSANSSVEIKDEPTTTVALAAPEAPTTTVAPAAPEARYNFGENYSTKMTELQTQLNTLAKSKDEPTLTSFYKSKAEAFNNVMDTMPKPGKFLKLLPRRLNPPLTAEQIYDINAVQAYLYHVSHGSYDRQEDAFKEACDAALVRLSQHSCTKNFAWAVAKYLMLGVLVAALAIVVAIDIAPPLLDWMAGWWNSNLAFAAQESFKFGVDVVNTLGGDNIVAGSAAVAAVIGMFSQNRQNRINEFPNIAKAAKHFSDIVDTKPAMPL